MAVDSSTRQAGIADHIHPEPQGFIRKYVFSIDHKIIGIQYLITGFVFFMLAGLLAEMIRTQLLQRKRRLRQPRRRTTKSTRCTARRWCGW